MTQNLEGLTSDGRVMMRLAALKIYVNVNLIQRGFSDVTRTKKAQFTILLTALPGRRLVSPDKKGSVQLKSITVYHKGKAYNLVLNGQGVVISKTPKTEKGAYLNGKSKTR